MQKATDLQGFLVMTITSLILFSIFLIMTWIAMNIIFEGFTWSAIGRVVGLSMIVGFLARKYGTARCNDALRARKNKLYNDTWQQSSIRVETRDTTGWKILDGDD